MHASKAVSLLMARVGVCGCLSVRLGVSAGRAHFLLIVAVGYTTVDGFCLVGLSRLHGMMDPGPLFVESGINPFH